MDNISDIVVLIRKKMNGTISAGESLFLLKWLEGHQLDVTLLESIVDEDILVEDVRDWLLLREGEHHWDKRLASKTLHKIHAAKERNLTHRISVFRKLLPYAAVLLVISAFVFMLYRSHIPDGHQAKVHDLTPGTNKALITLSDGSVIELRQDQEGVVLGDELTYEDGTIIAQLNDKKVVYATIETPRGGQYQITLADGTKVWLNAGTKLTYPSHFTGGTRVVELTGEAYFEVASLGVQRGKVPFIVKTAQQEVEVLGTWFNIKAYADDDGESQTTLVEGAVQLHASGETLLLHPGEQGVSNEQGLNKKKVEVDQYIAWKNNEFVFHETELKDVLKMLSRWYDFDVNLENHFPATHLYGSISRDKNLTEVLKILESSGLKFEIERSGNRNQLLYYMNNLN